MMGINIQVKEFHTFKALKKANDDVPVSCREVNSSSLIDDNISYLHMYVTNTVMSYNSYLGTYGLCKVVNVINFCTQKINY